MSVIDTRSLVDRVYEYLLNQIITGEVRYGAALNIKKLAAELKISTMPVREAIKRLEIEHIVEVKPRSSCQVRVPEREMILGVYELREVLETFALSKACRSCEGARLDKLRRIVADMHDVPKIKDPVQEEKRARELDLEFHIELCNLAENEYLSRVFRQMMLLVNMSLIHEQTFRRLERQYHESHAEILADLEQRRPERALQSLQKHFQNVKNLIAGREPGPGGGPAV